MPNCDEACFSTMTAREGSSWNTHLICSVLPIAVSLKSVPETGRVHCLPTCSTAPEQLGSSVGTSSYWYFLKSPQRSLYITSVKKLNYAHIRNYTFSWWFWYKYLHHWKYIMKGKWLWVIVEQFMSEDLINNQIQVYSFS